MSGDYKLGEMLYQATLDETFLEEVALIRGKYGVPQSGYSNQDKNTFLEWPGMVAECYELQIKYGIPHTNPLAVYQYALYGDIDWDNYESKTEPFYIIEQPKTLRHDIVDVFLKTNQPHVKLLIPSYASLSEVKEHLNKKWKEIQTELEKQSTGKLKRIRNTKNKNRNQLTKLLMSRTKEELSEEFGESTNKPKDIMVTNILKNKFGYDSSPEQVRSTPYRSRKK